MTTREEYEEADRVSELRAKAEGLSNSELDATIRQREDAGEPTSILRSVRVSRHDSVNRSKSLEQIDREIDSRRDLGLPTSHLERMRDEKSDE